MSAVARGLAVEVCICAGNTSLRDRAESPGRALREVKAKLNQFASKQQGPNQTASPSSAQCPTDQPAGALTNIENIPAQNNKPEVLTSASAEIADIDQRLHALQSFLKAAKAGGPVKP